jgi:hypothetical protein
VYLQLLATVTSAVSYTPDQSHVERLLESKFSLLLIMRKRDISTGRRVSFAKRKSAEMGLNEIIKY